MCQMNSSSMSNFAIKKYKNANLIVVNEREIRHEQRDKTTDLEKLIKKFVTEYKCKKIIVTAGSEGLFYFSKKNKKIKRYEAFTDKYIDKVGAGDVVYSISSLMLSSGVDEDISLIMSALGGHYAVNTVGNKEFVNFNDLR